MKKLKEFIKTITNLPIILLVIGILLIIAPIAVLGVLVNRIFTWIKGNFLLKKNIGKIYFLYHDYNAFDFAPYFSTDEVTLIKVNDGWDSGVLENRLKPKRSTHRFPRIVKIGDNGLIVKEHFNSFKHYVKREKDPDAFISLAQRSIKNLRYSS